MTEMRTDISSGSILSVESCGILEARIELASVCMIGGIKRRKFKTDKLGFGISGLNHFMLKPRRFNAFVQKIAEMNGNAGRVE